MEHDLKEMAKIADKFHPRNRFNYDNRIYSWEYRRLEEYFFTKYERRLAYDMIHEAQRYAERIDYKELADYIKGHRRELLKLVAPRIRDYMYPLIFIKEKFKWPYDENPPFLDKMLEDFPWDEINKQSESVTLAAD